MLMSRTSREETKLKTTRWRTVRIWIYRKAQLVINWYHLEGVAHKQVICQWKRKGKIQICAAAC